MRTVVEKERREEKDGGVLAVVYQKPLLEKGSFEIVEAIMPKFRDPSEMSPEQLTDPDYALKQLEKLNGSKLSITCSKCHHCR